MGRSTWPESEASASIFEPCCSYTPMVGGFAFSPTPVKIANLSAPFLRFGSEGPQTCVAWPTECFDLWGEELPPLKSGKSHIQFWSSNFSCKIRNSGNAGLHLLKMTPKGICVAAFRCKIQRFNRPLLSVYFLPGPYRHLSLRPLISALPRMVR